MLSLDELEKIAKAATPGFWFHNDKDGVFILTTPHLEKYCIIPVVGDKDGAFISAFSPQSCLELIAQLRKAEEALEHGIKVGSFPAGSRAVLQDALSELRGLGGGG